MKRHAYVSGEFNKEDLKVCSHCGKAESAEKWHWYDYYDIPDTQMCAWCQAKLVQNEKI